MLFNCKEHGYRGCCIVSSAVLQFQDDGKLPEMVNVELKNSPDEIDFFSVIMTPQEAEQLNVINGTLPFSVESVELTEKYSHLCIGCFLDQRKKLERESAGRTASS